MHHVATSLVTPCDIVHHVATSLVTPCDIVHHVATSLVTPCDIVHHVASCFYIIQFAVTWHNFNKCMQSGVIYNTV